VNVGTAPDDVEVNPATDTIFVCNSGSNNVTVINGATLTTTTTVNVGNTPVEAWVNPVVNRVYVTNVNDNTVSVLSGVAPNAIQFVNVTPCRLYDTRQNNMPILGGTSQNFVIPGAGGCGIPDNAVAYSLNVTVVPGTANHLGYLTIWPTGETQPNVSTMNSPDGRTKANAAIVPAGYEGAVSIYASNTTHVILDINGYFTAPAADPGLSTLQFYPLTPCRIVDTRNNQDGGTLQKGMERDFEIAGHCDIPVTAQAYSLNVTVIPARGGLDYLTVWPAGETQPVVSTLNDSTGTIVANAAIVPAGPSNATAFYPNSNNTDLLVDVDGYFAPAGPGGLSLYPAVPCRVLDTRQGGGSGFNGQITIGVETSPCAVASNAQAYVFNATVTPPGHLLYLTLWPHGEMQPTVSTLNANDGFVTSNLAIVPTNDGSIDAFSSAQNQLILDISGYFAP
jgi:YVTN family beta-propeller protein